MPKRVLAALMVLALPALGLADTATHPLATRALPGTPTLGLSNDLLQWGSTSLSYSSAWAGGEQFSLGLLTKDLRVPLGQGLDFNARFGVAFTPGTGNAASGDASSTRLVLPYAALDWRPTENTHLHLSFSQGGYGNYGFSRHGVGYADPWMPTFRKDEAETP